MQANPAQPIDVVIQTEPVPWWQIVAAVGPIILVLVIELVIIASLVLHSFRGRHAGRAGQGSEVDWEHIQWALDASVSNDPRKASMGQHTIDALLRLRLKKEDRDLLTAASVRRTPPASTESRGQVKKPS